MLGLVGIAAAPGLDGLTADWAHKLPITHLRPLTQLFDAADAGRLPASWAIARVCLIPKPGEILDHRPITVLPILYRLWCKRHTAGWTSWLASWRPHTLTGAMPGEGSADTLWRITSLISDAREGRSAPLHILSLDQAKCFDRLHLQTLRAMQTHFRLPVLDHVLIN